MGIKETLRKAFFEIEWDEGRKIKIRAMKADVQRVQKDGPALMAYLQEKANAEANGAELDFAEVDKAVRDCLDLMCGEEVGGQLYRDCVEYIGGEGATGEDCALQMVDVVVLTATRGWST